LTIKEALNFYYKEKKIVKAPGIISENIERLFDFLGIQPLNKFIESLQLLLNRGDQNEGQERFYAHCSLFNLSDILSCVSPGKRH
jgi:hypothetical protein